MRRELLIIAGVLVPFAALVIVGWLVTRPERPRFEERARPVEPPDAAVTHAPALAAALPDAGADAGTPEDPALAAPLRAVEPELRLCFADRSEHVREPIAVQISFRPTPDGGFDQVRIDSGGLPDPTFAACLEDVFAEVHFAPTGAETFQPARHTFVFDPPRR